MFGFKKNKKKTDLNSLLDSLRKNEITITAHRSDKNAAATASKFGGRPATPAGFEWPRFESENFDCESANRPLSFLCQVNLADVRAYDKDGLLPEKGLLLFFYEQESMRWGFDPEDVGCSRVYYFEDLSTLAPTDFPDDMKDEYKVREYDLTFSSADSYPSYGELECHTDADLDWEEYDDALEKRSYDSDAERHKLLGYANLIQGEMLTECERTTRGLYCGNPESYNNTSDNVKKDVNERAAVWMLLFQMASIEDDDFELMFGDLGNLYFYITKDNLVKRNFDKAWLVLQCG